MAWVEAVSRHRHYTPPSDQPQITFANVLDKLNALPPVFVIPRLDAEAALKMFRKYQQEPPSVPVDTSETAALTIQPKAGTIRAAVLSFIRGRGPRGATLREIATALRLSENTARPRCWELCGNVPSGRMPRPPLIYMSDEKRDGMRVYKAKHL